MANANNIQRLIDNQNIAIIKLSGSFDGAGGQETGIIKVDASNLNFALNTTGGLKSAGGVGTNALPRYRTSVRALDWSIVGGGQVTLGWDNTVAANQANAIIAICGGNWKWERERWLVENPHFNTSNGNIYLTTLGFGANSSYSITFELKKYGQHYDQGQIEAPSDFNR